MPLSTLINEENLSLWEHFHNAGAWNKTHETGWFLCQTAMMFVMERGDELWLAPMITNRWLEDGKNVTVRNAPTRFGSVDYSIVSHANDGRIEASIEPPKRNPPKQIVIRIRHPQGKIMKSVTVDGKPYADFDPITETIRLSSTGQPMIRVRAELLTARPTRWGQQTVVARFSPRSNPRSATPLPQSPKKRHTFPPTTAPGVARALVALLHGQIIRVVGRAGQFRQQTAFEWTPKRPPF